MTWVPSSFIMKTEVLVFLTQPLSSLSMSDPQIFHSDLRECNNSDDSDLQYKVTVRGAGQGTIFLDRLLICHSYCCGYCMTVHVLSSFPLTFMFHLILFFLGVNNINIFSLCLFEWTFKLWWRWICHIFISDRKTVLILTFPPVLLLQVLFFWQQRQPYKNATAEMSPQIYRT